MTERAFLLWCGLATVVLTALLYGCVAELPFFSESYCALALAARFESFLDAFDPALTPLRPVQHAYFHLLHIAGLDTPALARTIPYGLHCVAGGLVLVLARQLGCGRAASFLALGLFLAFPSVKVLAWVAAISGPARAVSLLAGLSFALAHMRSPSWPTGAGTLASLVLGLCSHQSAIVLPALIALLAHAEACKDGCGLAGAWRRLRDPWLLSVLAVTILYLVYVGHFRPNRHHGVVQAGAILANTVRAGLALAPEWLRYPAVEGFRGHLGGPGYLLGGGVMLCVAAGVSWMVRRGGILVVMLLLAIATDLVLPVLSTAFVQRYAYLSAALLAIALGKLAHGPRGGLQRAPLVVACALGLLWAWDHAVDIGEHRDAGAIVETLLHQAAEARAAEGPVPIALVDAPDMWGLEEDLPMFNWGLREALDRMGVPRPWTLYRRYRARTTSDHEQVDAQFVEELIASDRMPVFVFDPELRGYVRQDVPVR